MIGLDDKGHEDVIKWKDFPCYWTFLWGIHYSPLNYPHSDKGQGYGALVGFLSAPEQTVE